MTRKRSAKSTTGPPDEYMAIVWRDNRSQPGFNILRYVEDGSIRHYPRTRLMSGLTGVVIVDTLVEAQNLLALGDGTRIAVTPVIVRKLGEVNWKG